MTSSTLFTYVSIVRLKASLAGKGGPKKKKKRKTRRNENGKIWSYYRKKGFHLK